MKEVLTLFWLVQILLLAGPLIFLGCYVVFMVKPDFRSLTIAEIALRFGKALSYAVIAWLILVFIVLIAYPYLLGRALGK